MKTCFVSAPINVDLSVLQSVLRAKGIEAILPFKLEITGSNAYEQMEKAIRRADFCIAILPRGAGDPNVFLEIGYALANRKRIVLIGGGADGLPLSLTGLPVLKVDTNDRQTLSLLLDEFLGHKPTESRSHKLDKTRPLATRAKELAVLLKSQSDRITGLEFEQILGNAFRESGVRTLAEPQSNDRRYDFALWLDELELVVGNPVLVESKLRLSATNARAVKRRFLEQIDKEVGKALLVVFLHGSQNRVSDESIGAPLVLFIPAFRLLSELEQKSLGDFVRSERNKLVHGI